MRSRLALLLTFVLFTTSVFAKEVWIAVSGTANNVFFSDARVFNPTDHQITIQAYYLPRGNNDNSSETATSFTVPSRQMRIFDDVVASLLHRTDVGAIRFVSTDDFVVTQRVYLAADCDPSPTVNLPCTLGQFVQGQDVTAAMKKGVILQLKRETKFRTNIGGANTTSSVAHVTWRLYDKSNAIIATKTEDLQPYGVLGPSEVAGYFGVTPSTDQLADAWVSFVSDQSILAYGSVVDNTSGDQTYIAAAADSGTTPDNNTTPPKTVTVVARDFTFTVNFSAPLRKDDLVTFKLSKVPGSADHGFQLLDPNGAPLLTVSSLTTSVIEQTISMPVKGTYFFICTNSNCGTGHTTMTGEFVCEVPSDPGDGGGKY